MECKTRYDNHLHRDQVQGGLAPQTIHGFVRSLRAFASWLEAEGYTEDNIFKAIKPPKIPQVLMQPLTEDEIRRILVIIPQDTAEGIRNYAIVLTFLDCGIRLSELINLKIPDIDFAAGQFKVRSKGEKERIVPMGSATRRAIIRYMEHYRPQPVNPQEVRLFLTVAGEPISKDSVAKCVVGQISLGWSIASGWTKRWHALTRVCCSGARVIKLTATRARVRITTKSSGKPLGRGGD